MDPQSGQRSTELIRHPEEDYLIIGKRNLIRRTNETNAGARPKEKPVNQTPAEFQALPFPLSRGPAMTEVQTLPSGPANVKPLPPPETKPVPNGPESKPQETALILRTVLDVDGVRTALIEVIPPGKSEGTVHLVRAGDSFSGGRIASIGTKALVIEKDNESIELDIDLPAAPRKLAGGNGKNGNTNHGVEIRIESGSN
jgi:hypothetical protein